MVIADDITQTRTDLRRLLYFEEDLEVVGEAADGEEALSQVAQHRPDIVLIDVNMPVMDGITATEKVTRDYPDVAVVIISIQGEQEYLKKAMVAGARDYLIKPVNSEEISSTLRKVYSLEKERFKGAPPAKENEPPPQERIITFFSGKGGTGQSVLAVNLAVSLARQEHEVVLVDLDLQFGDLSLMLNLSDVKSISDLVEESEGINEQTLPQYLLRHNSGVHVISACYSPQDAEKVNESHLQQILDGLEKSFDYVIIDTPCAFNELTLYALERADLIMLPVRCDLASVKGAKTTINVLKALEHENKIRLLLNMTGQSYGVEKEDVENGLGLEVYHSIPRDDKQVELSINKGMPLALTRQNTEINKSLARFREKFSPSPATNGQKKEKQGNQEEQEKRGRKGLLKRPLFF